MQGDEISIVDSQKSDTACTKRKMEITQISHFGCLSYEDARHRPPSKHITQTFHRPFRHPASHIRLAKLSHALDVPHDVLDTTAVVHRHQRSNLDVLLGRASRRLLLYLGLLLSRRDGILVEMSP